MFYGGSKKMPEKGEQVSISGLNQDILMIFYIIKIDEHISLYNSEADALSRQNILVRRRFKLVKA
ncbi:MAG: hypothetical protein MZV64_64945 [Ignavibacteriales bacterium]|nr:hypothetical protein [Ignavibacteriales bacterium]